MSLELDRFVDVEDDPDAIVQKLNETVKARKEKLDALMRLEDKIDEMEAQQTETHESGDAERSKNTVAAVLRNIRQLDDKIRPGSDGRHGAGMLGKYGEISPLDEVPAHGADDCPILPQHGAGLCNMADMPVMNWIILTNNSRCFHVFSLQIVKFTEILDILPISY